MNERKQELVLEYEGNTYTVVVGSRDCVILDSDGELVLGAPIEGEFTEGKFFTMMLIYGYGYRNGFKSGKRQVKQAMRSALGID